MLSYISSLASWIHNVVAAYMQQSLQPPRRMQPIVIRCQCRVCRLPGRRCY